LHLLILFVHLVQMLVNSMKKQLHIQFGRNLSFLRKKYDLTQSGLAEKIAEGDRKEQKKLQKKIGSYEQGLAFPSPEQMNDLLSYFGVQYEQMVNIDLDSLSERDFAKLNQDRRTELQVLTISVSEDGRENIEMVPQKASAGYVRGFADRDYIRKLDRFHLPWLPPEATYRAFEISGDSMPPIETGSIVLGKYVEDKYEIKKGERYIIVAKDDILFKRIYASTKTEAHHSLLLVSDNPRYEPYEIAFEDVLEVWKFYQYISPCTDK
jgi:phage repressor protein C with HTH and peptisase S24 domain